MNLEAITKDLRDCELSLHHPKIGTQIDDIKKLIAPHFFEITASGKLYSTDRFLKEVGKLCSGEFAELSWKATDFQCCELGAGIYLLTYKIIQPTRKTYRSAIWQRDKLGWQSVYHQGTIILD